MKGLLLQMRQNVILCLQVIGTVHISEEPCKSENVIKIEEVVTSPDQPIDTQDAAESQSSPKTDAQQTKTSSDMVVTSSRKHRPPVARFACRVCGRRYAHQRGLNRHQREHHDVTSASKCRVCEKTFTRRYLLQRHLASAHGLASGASLESGQRHASGS